MGLGLGLGFVNDQVGLDDQASLDHDSADDQMNSNLNFVNDQVNLYYDRVNFFVIYVTDKSKLIIEYLLFTIHLVKSSDAGLWGPCATWWFNLSVTKSLTII